MLQNFGKGCEIWNLTGLNFERSSWHIFWISISPKWSQTYHFIFILPTSCSPNTRTHTDRIVPDLQHCFGGVGGVGPIRPNKPKRSSLPSNWAVNERYLATRVRGWLRAHPKITSTTFSDFLNHSLIHACPNLLCTPSIWMFSTPALAYCLGTVPIGHPSLCECYLWMVTASKYSKVLSHLQGCDVSSQCTVLNLTNQPVRLRIWLGKPKFVINCYHNGIVTMYCVEEDEPPHFGSVSGTANLGHLTPWAAVRNSTRQDFKALCHESRSRRFTTCSNSSAC